MYTGTKIIKKCFLKKDIFCTHYKFNFILQEFLNIIKQKTWV